MGASQGVAFGQDKSNAVSQLGKARRHLRAHDQDTKGLLTRAQRG